MKVETYENAIARQELSCINWDHLYMITDLNEAFVTFFERLCETFNKHFSVKERPGKNYDEKQVNEAVPKSSSQLKDMFYMSKSFPEL